MIVVMNYTPPVVVDLKTNTLKREYPLYPQHNMFINFNKGECKKIKGRVCYSAVEVLEAFAIGDAIPSRREHAKEALVEWYLLGEQ